MRQEVEKRLHRVMVKPSASVAIQCIHSRKCERAQNVFKCAVLTGSEKNIVDTLLLSDNQ